MVLIGLVNLFIDDLMGVGKLPAPQLGLSDYGTGK
jgi:hypothetical protein